MCMLVSGCSVISQSTNVISTSIIVLWWLCHNSYSGHGNALNYNALVEMYRHHDVNRNGISLNVHTVCQCMSSCVSSQLRESVSLSLFLSCAVRPAIVWARAWVPAGEVPHWEPHSTGAGCGDVRGAQRCLHVLWPQTGWCCSESQERERERKWNYVTFCCVCYVVDTEINNWIPVSLKLIKPWISQSWRWFAKR